MTQTSAASTAQQLTETITGAQLTFHNVAAAYCTAPGSADHEVVTGESND